MSMPEAPVHEDREAMASKYDVGTPGKVAAMKSKAESEAMQHAPDDQLGLCVARANSRHHATATLGINDVHLSVRHPRWSGIRAERKR